MAIIIVASVYKYPSPYNAIQHLMVACGAGDTKDISAFTHYTTVNWLTDMTQYIRCKWCDIGIVKHRIVWQRMGEYGAIRCTSIMGRLLLKWMTRAERRKFNLLAKSDYLSISVRPEWSDNANYVWNLINERENKMTMTIEKRACAEREKDCGKRNVTLTYITSQANDTNNKQTDGDGDGTRRSIFYCIGTEWTCGYCRRDVVHLRPEEGRHLHEILITILLHIMIECIVGLNLQV